MSNNLNKLLKTNNHLFMTNIKLSGVILLLLIVRFHVYAQDTLTYTIRPKLQAKKPALHVSFTLKTNEKGFIWLKSFGDLSSNHLLYQCIQNIKTQPKAKDIFLLEDKNAVIIEHTPNTSLHISCEVVSGHSDASTSTYYHRPIVKSAFFHLLGNDLFLLPSDELMFSVDWDLAGAVKITWKDYMERYP